MLHYCANIIKNTAQIYILNKKHPRGDSMLCFFQFQNCPGAFAFKSLNVYESSFFIEWHQEHLIMSIIVIFTILNFAGNVISEIGKSSYWSYKVQYDNTSVMVVYAAPSLDEIFEYM